MKRISLASFLAIACAVLAGAASQSSAVPESKVDEIFSRWTKDSPGCAVGVSRADQPVLQKAYGMADLEHDIPNKPDTIFEAGSVSKQFTAAAVLLLAAEGKLSLDDPARKYVPELPDYGAPLTIRHMLQHTSGLRDWGEVASIAGWPRTSRVHTHAHVVDILSRQKALNFPSGTRYSYSNSGYNLSAVIVSRVSGKSFAEFSKERVFGPVGMTSTSWRDDYTRIVKGRAVAYSQAQAGWRQNMPFENVHGNGGLLTTVGDLLKWNAHFAAPKIGDAALVKLQQEPGTFNDGKPHTYAMGLMVGTHKGVNEIAHSGSTAGYRAHLTRYPDQKVSVAVLCNAASANATQFAERVADLYLAGSVKDEPAAQPRPRPEPKPFTPDRKDLESYVGEYHSEEAEVTYQIALDGDTVLVKRRPDTVVRLRGTEKDHFDGGVGRFVFIRDGSGAVKELSFRGSRVFDIRFARAASQ
jgi:CubicO group peptidase (beta-lactamase class C family)